MIVVAAASPHSARVVLAALREHGPARPEELVARTQLPSRTVRWAVRWLLRQRVVRVVHGMGDARRRTYFARDP